MKLPDLRVTVAWKRVNHFRLRVLLRVKMLNFSGKLRVFHLWTISASPLYVRLSVFTLISSTTYAVRSEYHPDWKLGLSKITLTICSIRTLTCWLSKDVTELCHDSDCYLGSIWPGSLKFSGEKGKWEILHIKGLPQFIPSQIQVPDWPRAFAHSLFSLVMANQKFRLPKEITLMHVSDFKICTNQLPAQFRKSLQKFAFSTYWTNSRVLKKRCTCQCSRNFVAPFVGNLFLFSCIEVCVLNSKAPLY